MICLDANIVIRSFTLQQAYLVDLLDQKKHELSCSEIVRLEVMGYHKLQAAEANIMQNFFDNIMVIPIDKVIINQAITIRRERSIGIGDAIIAATTICRDYQLWTNNVKDFAWIKDLSWHNPIRL